MTKRPVVLNLIGAFRPGNDATGPNLSVRAMCEALANEFDFHLVGRAEPCDRPAILDDLGFARLTSLPAGRLGAHGLARLMRETPHDVLLLNGFFDREFTIPALALRKLGHVPRRPTLLSPRGEFSRGALALKSGRKRAYRMAVRIGGLLDGVTLHATSDAEAADVAVALPAARLCLVPNFRPLFAPPPYVERPPGAPVRLAFLGRISAVKGLDIALDGLAKANVPARFDIYGPISDEDYWQRCTKLIEAMPTTVQVIHHGEIANADAPAMLAAHDALLLPSLSENFGHAIFESLASGTPVIIGHRTPWRGLSESKSGYDCPVGDVGALAAAIQAIEAMEPAEIPAWRAGALARARGYAISNDAQMKMAKLLHTLIARGRR